MSDSEDSSSDGEEDVGAPPEDQVPVGDSPADITFDTMLTDVRCHPSRDVVAVATIDGDVSVRSYALDGPSHELFLLKHHKAACRKLRFSADGTLLFTVSKDGSFCVLDVNTGAVSHHVQEAHENPIYSLCVIDDYLAATGDDEGCFKLWDYRRQEAVMESKECDDFISDMVVDDAKKTLLAASGDGTLTAFNVRKKAMELQSELFDDDFLSLAILKRGRKVVVGAGDGSLNLFNWGQWGNMSDRFRGKGGQAVECLAPISESILCTGSADGNIRVASILPNRYLGVIGSHQKFPVESLSVSQDGDLLASCSHDQAVKFWNVAGVRDTRVDPGSKGKEGDRSKSVAGGPSKKGNFFAGLAE